MCPGFPVVQENVYFLVQKLSRGGVPLEQLFVVFVSNPDKHVRHEGEGEARGGRCSMGKMSVLATEDGKMHKGRIFAAQPGLSCYLRGSQYTRDILATCAFMRFPGNKFLPLLSCAWFLAGALLAATRQHGRSTLDLGLSRIRCTARCL